jgi:hypothetical protein
MIIEGTYGPAIIEVKILALPSVSFRFFSVKKNLLFNENLVLSVKQACFSLKIHFCL